MRYPILSILSISLMAVPAAKAGEPLIILKPGQTMANIQIRPAEPAPAPTISVTKPTAAVLTIPAIRSNQEIARQDNFIEIGKPRPTPTTIPAPEKVSNVTVTSATVLPQPLPESDTPPAASRVAIPVPGVAVTRYYIDTTPKTKKQKKLEERSAKALQQQKEAAGPVVIAPAKDRVIEATELAGSIEDTPVMRMPPRNEKLAPAIQVAVVAKKPIIAAKEPVAAVVTPPVQEVKPVTPVTVEPTPLPLDEAKPLAEVLPPVEPVKKTAVTPVAQATIPATAEPQTPWLLIGGLGGGGVLLCGLAVLTLRRKEEDPSKPLDWYEMMDTKKARKMPASAGSWDFDAV